MNNRVCVFVVMAICTLTILGCAPKQKYYGASPDRVFQNNSDAMNDKKAARQLAISAIKPLPEVLIHKQLLVQIPTYKVIYDSMAYSMKGVEARHGLVVPTELNEHFSESIRAECLFILDAIKASNVYESVELVDGDYISLIQPSSSKDVLAFFREGNSKVEWYTLSVKGGKQKFPWVNTFKYKTEDYEDFINNLKSFALQQ